VREIQRTLQVSILVVQLMAADIDESRLEAWRAFLRAHTASIRAIEGSLAEAGAVSLVEYDVLLALYHAPERRLRLRDLNQRLVLTRSGVTRLIDRLETGGLVRRERCGPDRRAAFAVLTEQGIEAMRLAWPIYARGIEEHFARYLTDEEVLVVTEALSRVAGTR